VNTQTSHRPSHRLRPSDLRAIFASPAAARADTLRVRITGSPDAAVAPGGGEVQLAATAEALGRLGVDVQPWHPDDSRRCDADCVHVFGSLPSHQTIIDAAHRRNIPVVLSTITWFDLAGYWRGGRTLAGRVAACFRFAARATLPALPSWRRRLYHDADLLLPNSNAEAEQLVRYFRVPASRIHVVHNGADERFARGDTQAFVERFGLRDFVLSIGRIEPRKNQLALLRAMRGTGVPIAVLGRVVPGHEAYLASCRHAAGPDATFLGHLEHDDPMLAAAYAACGCLALVSWFETPGLVALEAAMSGTPLVLPAGGSAREYFGDEADYVRPGDLGGIRRAVLGALKRGRSPSLARRIGRDFTWSTTARATRDAYRKVM
jgi:glycosyltransferase involved in cell wall biosynthesis